MSSTRKCKNCGSLDIEVDPARGDAVCTNCGTVLEVNIIVAEVQFEEGAHGTSRALGQFVAADSTGIPKYGVPFHGSGLESRQMTLRKARNGIANLCNQLKLSQHCIDTACNFFKLALNRNLTKGRRNSHVHAACVYLTCRTEGTAHLLIDISDVLQICCYELGRTYLRLSQGLSINIPVVDPCLYILRFAAQLEFGAKTQQVANTALRLVQRMKRDSIHSGRRPSGLCGAALLIAARLHEFGRTAGDIVKIVKVHESTLRKRLIEFGDTPSSALTLEEFMTVDLEEEQDPPSFKAARKKDKDRLQRLMEEEAESITELQRQIEMQLNKDAKQRSRKCKETTRHPDEIQETNKFIQESTIDTINEIIQNEVIDDPGCDKEPVKELGPDIASMGLANSLQDTSNAVQPVAPLDVDLTFDDIDDEELDSYIMSEKESKSKSDIWLKKNAAFLEEQRLKAEKLQKEREEGKPEKKKRRQVRRKPMGPANSAGEAIEKILQEKKFSSKINYDVLKSLNASLSTKTEGASEEKEKPIADTVPPPQPAKRPRLSSAAEQSASPPKKATKSVPNLAPKQKQKKALIDVGLPFEGSSTLPEKVQKEDVPVAAAVSEEETEDYYEEEEPVQQEVANDEPNEIAEMLRQHRKGNEDSEEEAYEGYDEDYY